jgi:predicted aspartyl protease
MLWAAPLPGQPGASLDEVSLDKASVDKTNVMQSTNLSVTIPFELARGRVTVPVRVNESKPLSFLLDTGYTITTIHPDLLEPLGLKRAGRVTIVGIAGEEEAGTYANAVFDIGGLKYTPRRVASLPSEAQSRRRRRDGILGTGFFRRFVVEIDSKAKMLRLHEPTSFHYAGPGEIVPFKFRKDTPVVEAAIVSSDQRAVWGRFELDTGCDDYLCLGHDFVREHQLNSAASDWEEGEKQGVGGGARIRSGHLPQLQLGRLTIDKPLANFFLDGSPVDRGLAGHIGLAALRRFKVVLDYSRQRMILEPAP